MLLGLAEQNQLYSPYSPYKKTTVPTAVPTPSLQSLESHASLDSVDDKLAACFARTYETEKTALCTCSITDTHLLADVLDNLIYIQDAPGGYVNKIKKKMNHVPWQKFLCVDFSRTSIP